MTYGLIFHATLKRNNNSSLCVEYNNNILLYIFINFFMQKWARVYRKSEYHAAVEINNGVEALNKLLKYHYLP